MSDVKKPKLGEENISSTILRIQSLSDIFGKAEARIAAFILKYPREIINFSITELAERCQVSEATVVRFCRKLKFKGYQDFKIAVAQEMVTPLQSIHEEVSEDDNCAVVLDKIFQSIIQTLNHTREILDFRELEKAADAILKARKVVIFGLGNSAAIALDMQHKLLRTGLETAAFADNHIQTIVASHLLPEDVAVGISHSGSSRDIVEALQIAKESGATTICITNYGKSPILKYADISLFTASQETKYRVSALASRVAQLGIIDTLNTYISLKKKDQAVEAIKRLERALQSKKY